MKLKLLTIFFLLYSNIALDYSPLSIKQLINQAEIIAKCQIVSVDETTFTVKFLDVIKGKANKNLKISKFINWTCATRAIDYEVGQTELIFLSKYKNQWKALGAGNEGEIFIQKDTVYYAHYLPVKKAYANLEVEEKKLRGIIFEYDNVKDAIKYYMQNSRDIDKMSKEEKKNFKSENMFLVAIVNCYNYS